MELDCFHLIITSQCSMIITDNNDNNFNIFKMDVGQPIHGYSEIITFFGLHPPDNNLDNREYSIYF